MKGDEPWVLRHKPARQKLDMDALMNGGGEADEGEEGEDGPKGLSIEPGIELEPVLGDMQFPLHAGARETHPVGRAALFVGALHVEVPLDLLGPVEGDLARLCHAQRVRAQYV
jgi:hypothetical protein